MEQKPAASARGLGKRNKHGKFDQTSAKKWIGNSEQWHQLIKHNINRT